MCAARCPLLLIAWERDENVHLRAGSRQAQQAIRIRPIMPNPWTGKGNPYSREKVIERLQDTLGRGEAIIAAGAGTGISTKFIEKGGSDLIIIYNSGRFRMAGHGSTAGLMAYGDANAVAMEIGEFEVLPVVEEVPVICGVHGSDPRRRMWHFLGQVKEISTGLSGCDGGHTEEDSAGLIEWFLCHHGRISSV